MFVNNHNMEFIEAALCQKLLELRNGARVVTVDPLPRDQDNWEAQAPLRADGAEGEFYAYGNRLERYARNSKMELSVLLRHAGRCSTSPRKQGRRGKSGGEL